MATLILAALTLIALAAVLGAVLWWRIIQRVRDVDLHDLRARPTACNGGTTTAYELADVSPEVCRYAEAVALARYAASCAGDERADIERRLAALRRTGDAL